PASRHLDWFFSAGGVPRRHHPGRRRGVVVSDVERPCRGRNQVANLLGLLYYEFRFLDRHQPRGHAYLGDFAIGERDLATAGHAMRGGHYGLRADDRRNVSHHSPWPPVAFFLAHALS